MDDLFENILQLQRELLQSQLNTIIRYQRRKLRSSPSSKRTSHMDIVGNILISAGKPLHISQIISAAKEQFQVALERDSIVSALVKKINAGSQFVRTAPNTFTLKGEQHP